MRKLREEKPLPAKPEGMTPEREEHWDAIHLLRLERRRARAERRIRAQQWAEEKKSATITTIAGTVPLFGKTMSNKDLRDFAWRQLMDGDPRVAVIANELLKLRRKVHGPDVRDGRQTMNARVYALALKYRSTLYTIDNVGREERARIARREGLKRQEQMKDPRGMVDHSHSRTWRFGP